MKFFSDNAAAVHPQVMDAIIAANQLDSPYDGDALSQALDDRFSQVFGTRVRALWVATGTAANALALSALCPPHKGVICHKMAHIEQDECGAPGFFMHGAKLILADGEGAKLASEDIARVLGNIRDDVHQVQPACVSITNASEYGLVYTPKQVSAIGDLCKAKGLKLHMDGARFANAVASTGAHPADITWRAGVDMLSFGCVKNGGMNAEAIIVFEPTLARELPYLRKRAGQLQSKGRFLAAQLLAMLEDDLWLANAAAANAGAQAIAQAAGDRLLYPVEANEVFVRLTAGEAASLRTQGFEFYDWGEMTEEGGEARFVTAWDQDAATVAPLAAAIAAL
ncbi:MAG: low specificity L-threonine aldolase [Blastomonas sp.]|jgi:threonine aldolase|uniref:threonine aldolase family protein n=1 Tax=unclassified Blastomonas TaxID=2626550 RepID=UPI00083CFF36|nr:MULTISPECIES: beta-eliminating lyase-related protein [unclassified Blastomonas]AOG01811.1 phenylserine aldolase [Blastomonas sp. RAC04]MCO5792205.1 low specificity L-threonine aldolase [Blastomonas sp.]